MFPFIVLFRFSLPKKYSALSSLTLDYIRLLYIVNEMPLHSVFSSLPVNNGFSKEDKIIIRSDYEEKRWSAYKIWKDHSSKKLDLHIRKKTFIAF